ncbi:unnamed protein product [Effrenium voratum]|uniref:RING-type E3 ubiquitin transferase (cysteine targeting) n=1 Tax=Effrenium voratum TaxID=2562239 RepID=A0AA36HTZ3_9DINO|nr:unnamed protein product [Effrenium voratum]CAJ1433745.1 unnamed protein product [Effrenium voratum]
MERLRTAASEVQVLRVNQLDARQLDGEITSILRQQLQEASLAEWPERFAPELDALLQVALWRYTVWIDEPTPGARLQNLRYGAVAWRGKVEALTKLQKFGFLLLWVLLPWLGRRGQELLERQGSPLATWLLHRAAPKVVALHSLLVAGNFLAFLRWGSFSELRDRLLGIRLVHIDPTARRQVAFEYMNRVMIWNGLSEFLMTVLPLVNLSRLRQNITRRLRLPQAQRPEMPQSCGFCGASPMTLPLRSSCNHVFCYYCVASEMMENPKASCPRCGERIESLRHLQ